jgi:ribulose-phosphate 3-epimerase
MADRDERRSPFPAAGTGGPRIVASVLPADLSRLGEAVAALEEAGVDWIQFDVMDADFVPNLTFGPDVIAATRRHTRLPFEAQLMVSNPDVLIERCVQAGCERVIVHAESTRNLHRSLMHVAEAGAHPAVAMNPATPVEAVVNVLDLVDLVLVMTVNPGWGGQPYLASMEPKLRRARAAIEATGRPIWLEVDGGIAPDTIETCAAAGADVFVTGSTLFHDPLGPAHAVADLRARATRDLAGTSGGSGLR